MQTNVIKYGDGFAILLNADLAERLNVRADTPVEITEDGNRLVVEAMNADGIAPQVENAASRIEKRYEDLFKRLA